jgi:hypothetical protein
MEAVVGTMVKVTMEAMVKATVRAGMMTAQG